MRLVHELSFRTQLGEHNERGELVSVYYTLFSQNMTDVHSSAASGEERGVSRARGVARRGRSDEREASVLKGSKKFLMREIACGPRSAKRLGRYPRRRNRTH